jgi:hypothetical protein
LYSETIIFLMYNVIAFVFIIYDMLILLGSNYAIIHVPC